MSRNSMIYQPTPNQADGSSFFEEAIDASLTPIEVGPGSAYITSPTEPAECKNRGGNEAPQNIQPSVIEGKKLSRRPHRQSQSQAKNTLLESSAPGQAVESAKPRKRDPKPKKQPKGQKAAGQLEELDDDGLPKDPQRRRVIERNRIAATKCRDRKRNEASALASREEAMENQNHHLWMCVDSLKAEIYYLKTQLLRHTHCNCILIQKHIANEAKKYMDGLLPCSSTFYPHDSSLIPDSASPISASTAGQSNMQGLKAHSLPPILTNSFQQGSRTSEVRGDMFDMGLEPLQMAITPPDSMVSIQPVPTLSPTECELGLYVNTGPQDYQPDKTAGNTH